MYKLFQSSAPTGQNIIPMHPPPIILHHHPRWCLRHHFFFYFKPEASYITYPSYRKLSYTALFCDSLYMVGLTASPKAVVNTEDKTMLLSSNSPVHRHSLLLTHPGCESFSDQITVRLLDGFRLCPVQDKFPCCFVLSMEKRAKTA